MASSREIPSFNSPEPQPTPPTSRSFPAPSTDLGGPPHSPPPPDAVGLAGSGPLAEGLFARLGARAQNQFAPTKLIESSNPIGLAAVKAARFRRLRGLLPTAPPHGHQRGAGRTAASAAGDEPPRRAPGQGERLRSRHVRLLQTTSERGLGHHEHVRLSRVFWHGLVHAGDPLRRLNAAVGRLRVRGPDVSSKVQVCRRWCVRASVRCLC